MASGSRSSQSSSVRWKARPKARLPRGLWRQSGGSPSISVPHEGRLVRAPRKRTSRPALRRCVPARQRAFSFISATCAARRSRSRSPYSPTWSRAACRLTAPRPRSSRSRRRRATPISSNSDAPSSATSHSAHRPAPPRPCVSTWAPTPLTPAPAPPVTPARRLAPVGRSRVASVRTLALIGLACGVGVRALCAQVTANVEAGISDVQYDEFLASAAASISPTMRWEHPRGRGFVSARGTYLRFESGRRSLDGSANASWFAPLARHWRGEVAAAAGASDYANFARFNHGGVDARLHLTDGNRRGWCRATLGRSSFGSGPRPVTVVALGVWLLRTDRTFFVSLDRSFVGETAYTYFRSSARWRGASIALEGIVGARLWSRGGGRGVFGQGSATLTLGRQAALVVSAGRYPTDAVSGSIAGRYVTAALRLGSISVRRPAAPVFSARPHARGSRGSVHTGG